MTSDAATAADEEAEPGSEGAAGAADPLVSNGLGSPSCRGGLGAGELSSGVRGNCETSGFVAAAAPTGDFGLDVHIDTGLLGLSSGSLLVGVQDVCVTPLWMALVWAVHALVVMLEWCFAIDLLDRPSVQLGIARGLRAAQAAFTAPWLGAALAVGSLALAYDGLVRRRVGESLARALLALAMTAGGLWVMLDPTGTVGSLGSWANQASLGTLAVSASGSPGAPQATLDDAMRTLFAAVVEGPWCYLEFGDVGWCREERLRDPHLRAAAQALASAELSRVGCSGEVPAGECVARGSAEASALEGSARLLRTARTNGAIFLALPANGAGRNSINDSGSLLRAICQSDDATHCHGASASEAEFRTNHGTWPRVGGLMLIAAGAFGALLLLGYLALRLLTAALFCMVLLLLAPLVALAPPLGENGRAAFRRWAAQLLAALVSKLLFSFALGAMLAVLSILASLEALGWWTQWLLMSAFWWAAFARRHQVLELAGVQRTQGHSSWRGARPRGGPLARRRIVERVRAARERLDRRSSEAHAVDASGSEAVPHRIRPPRPARVQRPHEAAGATDRLSRQVERLAGPVPGDERARRAESSASRAAALDTRAARIRQELAGAQARGERRRAARLSWRAERVEREAAVARSGHMPPWRARATDRADRRAGAPASGEATSETAARTRFLDRQAALPAATERRAPGEERREYAALSGLIGRDAREYERLDGGEQRRARLAIDRELALRREALGATGALAHADGTGRPWRAPGTETPEPSPRADRRATDVRPATGGTRRSSAPSESESPVMRDARAVAERRKRQLGPDTP